MSEEKSKGPLLFIQQPFVRTPSTNMQDTYTIKHELLELDEEKPSEEDGKIKISLAKKELEPEQIIKDAAKIENPPTTPHTNSQETTSKPPQKRQHSSLKKVKPFKEMSIEERIEYLKNYPKVLPPAPCVFVTEENNYQGYLIDYDGHDVTIRFHDKTTKTVPVLALTNIFLIGIGK
ncbi:CotO family spore coat protein [Bacillus sp. UNC41MFS5]|uniref:CotO family spore coat protein n=1 Tax=Bacillus sp. UNC41MFS5 TaxID=1449046 RepID=UPI00047896D2|nr:CotO family spore coat protein [Bacillus sp. UNC41MFS5]